MRKEVILCVDDENIVLQSIKTELLNLFDSKFLIETAESGPEALEIFGELLNNRYDIPVIISDYIMPGMKGDELLKNIHRISPRSLKIMLTGQAKIEGITNAINHANLFYYLEKPWKKDVLKEIIGKALAYYYQNKALTTEHSSLSRSTNELKSQIQAKTLELNELRERLNKNGRPDSAGELSKNMALFEEINTALSKIKTNMDSLAKRSNMESCGGDLLSSEVEEQFYQSSREEIERIIMFINRLKRATYE